MVMDEFTSNIRFARYDRCKLSMRVRVQQGNAEALLMRHSGTGTGLCASCAATLFLHSIEHIKTMLDAKPEMLLWEPMQHQFAALMVTGNADAKPEEIDWQAVKNNWELPWNTKVAKKRRSRMVEERNDDDQPPEQLALF